MQNIVTIIDAATKVVVFCVHQQQLVPEFPGYEVADMNTLFLLHKQNSSAAFS